MTRHSLLRRRCCVASLLGWVAGASAAGDAGDGASRIRISTLALESDPTSQWAARVMIEAYRRLSMEPEFHSMPAERSLVSANAGETEAELYRRAGIEKGYPNLVRVPVPVATYEIVAFVLSTSELSIVNWNSLAGTRVAYVKGIKVIEENAGGMQSFPVAALAQAFGMLERGRVEVVLANRISGVAALRALKLTGIEAHPQALVAFPVYHYLHTSRRALLPKLTQVLQDMTRERWMRASRTICWRGTEGVAAGLSLGAVLPDELGPEGREPGGGQGGVFERVGHCPRQA